MRPRVHPTLLVPLCGALLAATVAPAAGGDPVVENFRARCVAENSYRQPPAELAEACACMAPVLVSFLTPEARRQIETAIRGNRPASLGVSPFAGDPAELARRAIRRCPTVGAAIYRQKCTGNEAAPQCLEMRALIEDGF